MKLKEKLYGIGFAALFIGILCVGDFFLTRVF